MVPIFTDIHRFTEDTREERLANFKQDQEYVELCFGFCVQQLNLEG